MPPQHCTDLTGPGVEPDFRTDSARLATELTGRDKTFDKKSLLKIDHPRCLLTPGYAPESRLKI